MRGRVYKCESLKKRKNVEMQKIKTSLLLCWGGCSVKFYINQHWLIQKVYPDRRTSAGSATSRQLSMPPATNAPSHQSTPLIQAENKNTSRYYGHALTMYGPPLSSSPSSPSSSSSTPSSPSSSSPWRNKSEKAWSIICRMQGRRSNSVTHVWWEMNT